MTLKQNKHSAFYGTYVVLNENINLSTLDKKELDSLHNILKNLHLNSYNNINEIIDIRNKIWQLKEDARCLEESAKTLGESLRMTEKQLMATYEYEEL